MASSTLDLTSGIVPQAQALLGKLLALAKNSNVKQAILDFNARTSKKHVLYAVLGYLAVVRLLRYQRETALRRKYGYHDRASLSKMTTTEAYEIITAVASLEFPRFHTLSLEFGLFKVRRLS